MSKTGRVKAFFVHLSISVAIFIGLFLFIKYSLYPGVLFEVDGGRQGLVIIALVDLVMGPLLTLIVYKKGKPGLSNDLVLIGIFQFACLAAGLSVTMHERPLALVLSYDGFHVVNRSSLDMYDKDASGDSFWAGELPKYLYVELPTDKSERLPLQLSQLKNGPLYMRKSLLKSMGSKEFEASRFGVKKEYIIEACPALSGVLDQIEAKYNLMDKHIIYMQLIGKYVTSYVVFNNDARRIVEVLPSDKC